MANCQDFFLEFENQISLTSAQKKKLASVRVALQKKVRNELIQKKDVSFQGFWIQGSAKFNTTVLNKKGTYDVDLGVFLSTKPLITCTTVQKYILNAVKGHTPGGASHLQKCIRVNYAGAFDVDLPVYYKLENEPVPYIAVKNKDWRKDDPKGTWDWFKEKSRKTDGQLVRIIKYLKIWAGEQPFKVPSGFALTIWAAENFTKDTERDDRALLKTLESIRPGFWSSLGCEAPKEPKDDLLLGLNLDQKEKFEKSLKLFIADAKKALDANNKREAAKLWRKHLGRRFPLPVL